ncbi:CRISPR-associated protein Cas5 [Caminibacter sp.]
MKIIRVKIKGVLNSFRVPFFRTYHKSFLAPPKTTIVGMLCNISLKTQREFFEILNKNEIEISVVIDEIKGKAKDLWSYKTFEKKNRGKSVIRRDKLFESSYIIYLKIDNQDLYQEILTALKNPKNTPSLGLDDELIDIYEVKEIELLKNETKKIDSVFLDKGFKYKALIKDLSKPVELPTFNITPTKFKAFDNKGKQISKEIIEEFRQVEYINCEIEFEDDIDSFIDKELNKRIIFY